MGYIDEASVLCLPHVYVLNMRGARSQGANTAHVYITWSVELAAEIVGIDVASLPCGVLMILLIIEQTSSCILISSELP